jgi:hypothetical protein
MIWAGEFSEEWQRHFALFPTTVENSRKVVWLQYYWKRYIPGPHLCNKCNLSASTLIIGHWATSATNPNQTRGE